MKSFIQILFCLLLSQISFSQQNFWQLTNAPTSLKVVSIATKSNGYIFIAAEDSGVYRSTNFGQDWMQVNDGFSNVFVMSLAVELNGDLFAGAWGVYRSTDNGENWIQCGTLNAAVDCFLFKPNGIILVGTGGGVYRSTDDGETWTHVSNGLPNPSSIDVISLVSNNNDDVFAGTGGYGIYRSTNNGDNWTEINNGLPSNEQIRSITINQAQHLFAGSSSNGVYCSTNNGDTWFSAGLSSTIVMSIIMNSIEDIFAGVHLHGVYISEDNGTTWTEINSGLTNMFIRCLTVDLEGFVYIGTDGGGVYRSTISTTEVLNPDEKNFTSYTLNQNYPNPFNPNTKISWQTPEGSWQTLKIYDVLGNEVSTLVDEYKPAGTYEVTWYAESLPSGVYFYQLKAENYIETKKMILLK